MSGSSERVWGRPGGQAPVRKPVGGLLVMACLLVWITAGMAWAADTLPHADANLLHLGAWHLAAWGHRALALLAGAALAWCLIRLGRGRRRPPRDDAGALSARPGVRTGFRPWRRSGSPRRVL